MLLSEVVSQYLAVGCKHFAPDTLAERKFILGKLSDALGDKDIADCKPIHLLSYLEGQVTWKAQTTRSGRTFRILACFNWAKNMGLIDNHPFGDGKHFRDFIGPQDGDVGFPGVSDEDFAKFLEHCRSVRLKRAVLFLRYTGCRPIEMRRLVWSHVDMERRLIIQAHHKSAKKTGEKRVIQITDEVAGILEAVRSEQLSADPDRHVFENERGRSWAWRQSYCGSVRRIVKAAGLDTSSYGFGRVSYIERGILGNVNGKALATLVGHIDSTMIDRVYSRRIAEYTTELRATASQIANAPLNKRAG